MRPTSATILTKLGIATALTGLLRMAMVAITPTAAAPPDVIQAPRIVNLAVHGEPTGSGSTVYRLWTDGLIEHNRRECAGCPWLGWFVVSGD